MTDDRFDDRKVLEKSLERIPWHRAGQPDDIAKAILYLDSDDADSINWHILLVDGSLTMRWGKA